MTSAQPGPPGAATSAAVFAELEAQRWHALFAFWRGILVLMPSLPLTIAPFLLLAWIGSEPAPGSFGAELAPTARAWLDRHGDWFPAIAAWPLVWLFGSLWVFRRFGLRPKWRYAADFKRRVYAAVCSESFPGLTFEPDEGIGWKTFDGSGLFPYESAAYYSEDRFSGCWGEVDVCFAEARAERERSLLERVGDRPRYEEYFRGLVFIADFHKHFHSTTRLIPAGEKAPRSPGEEPAELEDPTFHAVFQVWTTDQVDVRYVLSTSMMARLTALSRRFRGMRARLSDERLLLMLPGRRDRFEPSLYRRAASTAQIESFVADVEACLEVVEALNLDLRIWSKR